MASLGEWIYLLLAILMGFFNLLISITYFLQGIGSKIARKMLNVETSKRTALDYIYTATWIFAGVLSVYIFNTSLSISMVPIFLAFKSGSDIGARTIFVKHDIAKIKGSRGIKRVIAEILTLTAIPSAIFIVLWAFFNEYIQFTFGYMLGKSLTPFTIWTLGLLFGLSYGVLRSYKEKAILLKGELALVLAGKIL